MTLLGELVGMGTILADEPPRNATPILLTLGNRSVHVVLIVETPSAATMGIRCMGPIL